MVWVFVLLGSSFSVVPRFFSAKAHRRYGNRLLISIYMGDFYMNWIYLFIAGILEVGWAIGLKYTEGWSRLVPSVLTAAAMIASFTFCRLP